MRFFTTTGPVICHHHYCLSSLQRFDMDLIQTQIEQHCYFMLHAPRQTGKTSFLLALMDYLNEQGQYHCVYANVESAQAARENVLEAMKTILGELATRATLHLNDPFPDTVWRQILAENSEFSALNLTLTAWAEQQPKPLILLIDEIDSLIGDTLVSVLRQLRSGYDRRHESFPQTVILCGVRDIRDYRIQSERSKEIITGGSAFNVKAESLRLGDFTQEEVSILYQQHTEETGQLFAEGVMEQVWHLTQGQPWLVNALGYEMCFRQERGRDRTQPLTADMVHSAKERLIRNRETHLDQLTDKLKEARVRRVISPMLQGTELDETTQQDDVQYTIDLGLVRRGNQGLVISNPIYQEIIPRELSHIAQLNLESLYQPAWYIAPDGQLNMTELLSAFQQFFREHAEHWVERFDYKESGPQLLVQAFLQRIVNGGGRVEREYGLGQKRTDLLLIWPYAKGTQRVVLELKIRTRSLPATIQDGLIQTDQYMDRTGTTEGHFLIFDRRPHISWNEKIFQRVEQVATGTITVWGM